MPASFGMLAKLLIVMPRRLELGSCFNSARYSYLSKSSPFRSPSILFPSNLALDHETRKSLLELRGKRRRRRRPSERAFVMTTVSNFASILSRARKAGTDTDICMVSAN